MPRVSVIIPAYNVEDCIVQCVESVLAQDLEDIEVIVIDDGSTDSTYELVSELANRDERLKLIKQQNSFAGVARNKGMDIAQGQAYYFLDGDDYIEKNCLSTMLEAMESSGAEVVVCPSLSLDVGSGEITPLKDSLCLVDTSKVYVRAELGDLMFRFCKGWPWDKLFDASFIKRHKLKFQDFRTTNDAYFVFCALMLASKIAFVDEPLVTHRTNLLSSLEQTRHKSWRCALDAAFSIDSRMKNEGLRELFGRAFDNWLLNFSIWNIFSLEIESQEAFLSAFKNEVVPRIPLGEEDESYYYVFNDWRVGRLLSMHFVELLETATSYQDEMWRNYEDYSAEREKLTRHLDELSRQLDEVSTKYNIIQSEYDEIVASRSYKLARKMWTTAAKLRGIFLRG